MPEPKPSRAVAAVLALVAPPGVAHAYLGMPLRGVVWLAARLLLAIGAMALGPSLGLGPWGVLGVIAVPSLGQLADVAFIPSRRFGKPGSGAVVGLLVAGAVVFVGFPVALRMLVIEAFKIPAGSMAP